MSVQRCHKILKIRKLSYEGYVGSVYCNGTIKISIFGDMERDVITQADECLGCRNFVIEFV